MKTVVRLLLLSLLLFSPTLIVIILCIFAWRLQNAGQVAFFTFFTFTATLAVMVFCKKIRNWIDHRIELA